jgi:hypothetical protein
MTDDSVPTHMEPAMLPPDGCSLGPSMGTIAILRFAQNDTTVATG